MGLHPSLKRAEKLGATRNVLNRSERIKWLQGKGCDEGQGYYFSKPVSAEEIGQLLSMPR